MPLTEAGKKAKRAMKKHYGAKKGERVFYALENKRKGLTKGKGRGKKKQPLSALKNDQIDQKGDKIEKPKEEHKRNVQKMYL